MSGFDPKLPLACRLLAAKAAINLWGSLQFTSARLIADFGNGRIGVNFQSLHGKEYVEPTKTPADPVYRWRRQLLRRRADRA
jgi:hypothetical protein